jgi:hypothetical protein
MTALGEDPFVVGVVDRTRRFLPEHISPLSHTPAFAELSANVRLRYNQLFASSYHEHFIFLERTLAAHVLPALVTRFGGDPLAERLLRFRDEEEMHTGWFHRLHRASEPALYQENYHHFVRVPGLAQRLFTVCARRPAAFPFLIWLAMIIEERTLTGARDTLREADVLEPHYVRLHRLHAAAEVHHVGLDAELLKRLWPALRPAGRLFNRWMFVTLLREFFQLPKRAGWRVVLQLASEQPEVVPLLPRLRRELLGLGEVPEYLATIYSRRREPRTFALADGFSGLRRLEASLLGPRATVNEGPTSASASPSEAVAASFAAMPTSFTSVTTPRVGEVSSALEPDSAPTGSKVLKGAAR